MTVRSGGEGRLHLVTGEGVQLGNPWSPRRTRQKGSALRMKGVNGDQLSWNGYQLSYTSSDRDASQCVFGVSGAFGEWIITLPWEDRLQYGLGGRGDSVRLLPGTYPLSPGEQYVFSPGGRGLILRLEPSARGTVELYDNGHSKWQIHGSPLNLTALSFASATALVGSHRKGSDRSAALPAWALGCWLDARHVTSTREAVWDLRRCWGRALPYTGVLLGTQDAASTADFESVAKAAGFELKVETPDIWKDASTRAVGWRDPLSRSKLLQTDALSARPGSNSPPDSEEEIDNAEDYLEQAAMDTFGPWSLAPLRSRVMPWQFGEQTLRQARKLLWTRVNLLPYLEILRRRAGEGVPMAAPLWWYCPEDPHAYEWESQYQLGPSFLVVPPERTEGERTMYFPAGEWMSWWEPFVWQGPLVAQMPQSPVGVQVFVRTGRPIPVRLGDTFTFGEPVKPEVSRCLLLFPDRAGEAEGVFWKLGRGGLRVELEEQHGYKRFLFGVGRPQRVFVGKHILRQAKDLEDLARGLDGWCWLPETGGVAVRCSGGSENEFFLEGASTLRRFDRCVCPRSVPGDRPSVDVTFGTTQKTLPYAPLVGCEYWDGTQRKVSVERSKDLWTCSVPIPSSAKGGGSMFLSIHVPDSPGRAGLRLTRQVDIEPVVRFTELPECVMIRGRDTIRVGLTKEAEGGVPLVLELDAPAGVVVEEPKRHVYLEAAQVEREIVFPYSIRSGVPMGEQVMTLQAHVGQVELEPCRILAIKPFPWLLALGPEKPSLNSNQWRPLPSQAYLNTGELALDEAIPLGSGQVAYLRTEFCARESRRVLFRVTAQGALSLWLNGRSIFDSRLKQMEREATAEGRVRSGNNELLVFTSPAEKGWRLSLRMTNPDGSPLAAWYPVDR